MTVFQQIKLGCLALALSAGVSTPALAQPAPTNQELDQRLRGLERNMEQILDLMRRQQGGGQPPTPSGPASPSQPAVQLGLRAGLTLDLFTLPLIESKWGNGNRIDDVPTAPTGLAAASSTVGPTNGFLYDAFLSNQSMSRFSGNIASDIGLLWDGLVQVSEQGRHMFQVEMVFAENSYAGRCVTQIQLNSQTVANLAGHNPNGSATTYTSQGAQQLAVGTYQFRVWLACSRWDRTRAVDYRKIQVNIFTAGPNDRAPQPLQTSRIFTRG